MENNHISKNYKAIQEELRKAGLQKKQCIKCSKKDNDYKPRHGLCLDCFCEMLNACMDAGMKMEEALDYINKKVKKDNDRTC